MNSVAFCSEAHYLPLSVFYSHATNHNTCPAEVSLSKATEPRHLQAVAEQTGPTEGNKPSHSYHITKALIQS